MDQRLQLTRPDGSDRRDLYYNSRSSRLRWNFVIMYTAWPPGRERRCSIKVSFLASFIRILL